MKMNLGITTKLLIIIIPLVCLPVIVVGYLSYHGSVSRITRLSEIEQTTKATAAAGEINSILDYCRNDLEIIVKVPLITDYYYTKEYNHVTQAELNLRKIVKLFEDVIQRSELYYRIRLIDQQGNEAAAVGRAGEEPARRSEPQEEKLFQRAKWIGGDQLYTSEITYSANRQGLVVYFVKPIVNIWGEFAGEVVIDLDYEKILELVKSIKVGEGGYAFLVDEFGRMIAHPLFAPYEFNLAKYPDPRLREFIIDMMAGETGWKTYSYFGEKAAAYAPIPSVSWSLAVTIPIEEFKKEAMAIRKNVAQVVVVTLLIAGLAYNLLRPVKRLVAATERIAAGDLYQDLPVASRDELGALTGSFNRMIRNIREMQDELVRSEKLVSLGRLSAGVAHEIRNPLNAMKGAIVYMQRRKKDDPLIQEYTQLILEEIDRLNRVVTEFLYFAKQSAPRPVPTQLNDLIVNTLNLFEERFREGATRLSLSLDPTLPRLMLDSDQIEQVLVNLIINAMDAMPRGGDLEMLTYLENGAAHGESSDFAQLVIRDTGMGIAQEDMKNIFDPFFSAKEGGTGLGLPLSLGIIENHGARLRIRSAVGKGTLVTVEFPVEGLGDSTKPANDHGGRIGGRSRTDEAHTAGCRGKNRFYFPLRNKNIEFHVVWFYNCSVFADRRWFEKAFKRHLHPGPEFPSRFFKARGKTGARFSIPCRMVRRRRSRFVFHLPYRIRSSVLTL